MTLAVSLLLLLAGFTIVGLVLAGTQPSSTPAKRATPTQAHFTWVCYDPVETASGVKIGPRECKQVELPR